MIKIWEAMNKGKVASGSIIVFLNSVIYLAKKPYNMRLNTLEGSKIRFYFWNCEKTLAKVWLLS